MTRRRILVGAHCFADAEPAIPLAVDLAKQMGATLHGIFAEDETMLDLSHSMTFAAVSGTRRLASRDAMERACLADAKAFRRMLARVADAERIDWSFDTGRGSIPSLFQTTGRRGDLLLYGYRPPFTARNGIVVIADGAKGTDGLIDLAVALAERSCKPLHAIVVGEKGPAALDTSKVASVEHTASVSAACDALQKRSPAAVVIAMVKDTTVDLREILDAARAPLIAVVP